MWRPVDRLAKGGWMLVIVGVLTLGVREALASPRAESCEDCDFTTNCERCCIDWDFLGGFCPPGGGSCLCY